jgi:hypothetical protein
MFKFEIIYHYKGILTYQHKDYASTGYKKYPRHFDILSEAGYKTLIYKKN